MEELNLKVFFMNNMYFVGTLVPNVSQEEMVFDFLFMLIPQQSAPGQDGITLSFVPFGMEQAEDRVTVRKESILMMADATKKLKSDYDRLVGDFKAKRAGIVLAPANALNNIPKPNQRPNVQKLI
jgi:hypothetical protein